MGNKIEYAAYSIILLNSKISEAFLKSITFTDAKRIFTKDILMRLDLLNIALAVSRNEIERQILIINEKYNLKISTSLWECFIKDMTPLKSKQLSLFE